MSTTAITSATRKDRSYTVRRQIAAQIGARPSTDLSPRTLDFQVWLSAVETIGGIPAGECVELLSTDNAGFRGIEATVLDESGCRHYGVSLGAFAVVLVERH